MKIYNVIGLIYITIWLTTDIPKCNKEAFDWLDAIAIFIIPFVIGYLSGRADE